MSPRSAGATHRVRRAARRAYSSRARTASAGRRRRSFVRARASGPVAPFHRLQPNTDVRLAPAAPPPEAAFSLFSPPPPPSEPPPPSAVLRERDWGATDLFSTLRTEFSSSGLASLGGAADAHFIAPAEHMKRLFTLPYSEGRVAFPVHNIGGSLVVDGDAAGWESAAAERVTDAAAGEAEAALVDALGRMGLLTGAADAAAGDGGGGEDGGSSAALSFAAVAAAASARPTPAAAPPKPKAPLPAPRARCRSQRRQRRRRRRRRSGRRRRPRPRSPRPPTVR